MEKLINLLNEYEGYSKDAFNRWRYDEYGYITEGGDYLYIGTEQKIVSKKFGFIEWLVDNDKIDKDNKFLISVNVENQKNGMGYTKACEGYESLLMLLAIQDKPIEFLISILK